jgi:hypothetical protein
MSGEGQYMTPRLPEPEVATSNEHERRIALVHVLTPEFQKLDVEDFADLPEDQIRKATPEILRKSLIDIPNEGASVLGYRTPEEGWVNLSVTPKEFGLFSRHIPMLAKAAFNGVLHVRDKKLREETGDPSAKARSDDDIRAANRASVRQVMSKRIKMEAYLEQDMLPRVDIINKFSEMLKHTNLARGTEETVRKRFEELRLFVFGDMLDAIGNQRKWSPRQAEMAVRILQAKMYLDPLPRRRVNNFRGMVGLADEYYGHKRALVLGRIAESNKFIHSNPEVLAEIEALDRERSE